MLYRRLGDTLGVVVTCGVTTQKSNTSLPHRIVHSTRHYTWRQPFYANTFVTIVSHHNTMSEAVRKVQEASDNYN